MCDTPSVPSVVAAFPLPVSAYRGLLLPNNAQFEQQQPSLQSCCILDFSGKPQCETSARRAVAVLLRGSGDNILSWSKSQEQMTGYKFPHLMKNLCICIKKIYIYVENNQPACKLIFNLGL